MNRIVMYGSLKMSDKLRQSVLRPFWEAPWMVWLCFFSLLMYFPEPLLSCVIQSQTLVVSKDHQHYTWHDMIWYDIFNCNWVATRWQLYSTHVHTNNTEKDTKQTIHKTTQKVHRTTQKLGRVRVMPHLCGFYPGICLTTEEKARKNLSQGSHTWTYTKNT